MLYTHTLATYNYIFIYIINYLLIYICVMVSKHDIIMIYDAMYVFIKSLMPNGNNYKLQTISPCLIGVSMVISEPGHN